LYAHEELEDNLKERFEQNIPCFGIFIKGKISGAAWCKPWTFRRPFKKSELENVFEISNIFIASDARGQGLGRILLYNTIVEMFKLNRSIVISRIYSDRIGSIKLHKSVGFDYIGKLFYGFILGFRVNRFFHG
jgi:L-amino acid N-acyltransferase YncA